MQVLKVYLVEIGWPQNYDGLLAIAKRNNGVYHPRIQRRTGSAFMFMKEADAEAFVAETKDWPQREEP